MVSRLWQEKRNSLNVLFSSSSSLTGTFLSYSFNSALDVTSEKGKICGLRGWLAEKEGVSIIIVPSLNAIFGKEGG